MIEYQIRDQKSNAFTGYQTINFCEKLIADYNQDDVDAYQPNFGKLFKWLTGVIALRKQDIIKRKAANKRDIEYRQEKIKEKQIRAESKEVFLLEALDKFNTETAEAVETYNKY